MSRPKRLSSHNYVGHALYFLTFCTHERVEAFRDSDVAARTLEQFRRTAAIEHFAIRAYCLMPDHAHYLVEALADSADLRRFVKIGKQRSGAACALGGGGRLWQEGYFEHVLRQEEDARGVAAYILENPVRAKLVARVEDYPFVGSDVWSLRELLGSL